MSTCDPNASLSVSIVCSKLLFGLLQDFLNHLLKQAKKDNEVTEEKLIEYTDTMVITLKTSTCARLQH